MQLQIAGGKLKISWYYEPTSDTTRTFTLRYRVLGAVRVSSESDQVWWVAIFPERSVPVQRSQVTLRLPAGAQLRAQDVTLPAAVAQVDVAGNTIRVTRDEPLPAGQSLDVRVDFDPGLVSAQPPAWQSAPAPQSEAPESQPAAESLTPVGWLLGGFFGLLSCLGVPLLIVVAVFVLIRGLIAGSTSGSHHRRHSNWSGSDSSSSSWSSSDSGSSWSSSDSGSSWSSSDSGSDGGSGGGGGDAG